MRPEPLRGRDVPARRRDALAARARGETPAEKDVGVPR